jgi:hypothetical protein
MRTLQQQRALRRLIPPRIDPSSQTGRDDDGLSLLLWGVPVSGPESCRLADRLEQISQALGEKPAARSEPDIVVACDGWLAIGEAKLGSRNDIKPANYGSWPLYYSPQIFSAALEGVAATGLYELVRNWRIGTELAADRRFLLINLASTHLTEDKEILGTVVRETSDRQVATHTWSELLDQIPSGIRDYARERGAIADR